MLYVGISDAPAWWIAQANTLAHLRGWSPFVGLQIEYSLIERTVERELVPMAKALNLGLTAWSPLSGGVLSGKYHGHGSSEQARLSSDMMKGFMPEQQRADHIVAAVKNVSDETGRSMAQVALAWLRYRPVPIIPIIGARKLSQLQDNLASFDLTLSAEQLKTLDEASRIELGFPHDLMARTLSAPSSTAACETRFWLSSSGSLRVARSLFTAKFCVRIQIEMESRHGKDESGAGT